MMAIGFGGSRLYGSHGNEVISSSSGQKSSCICTYPQGSKGPNNEVLGFRIVVI